MINLINETLIHPHINTKWTVVNCEKGMLECVSEDSAKVDWITKEYGLEMYAEQQKQRADELEQKLNKEVEESYQMENRWRTEIERADRAEKRWEKLKEHFINEKEQSLGILSWSRNDGMLELMEQLEEEMASDTEV